MNRESRRTTDNDLLTRVSKALAADERTAETPIEVIAEQGLVTLEGEVKTMETRRAAEQIAAAQPGVIQVVNDLGVVPDDRDDDLIDVEHFAYFESRPPVIPDHDIKDD